MSDKDTILVVDDTFEVLALLVKLLTLAGYQAHAADSGELALAAVAKNPPDLILLDVRMQGMDGLEVCRRLQSRKETQHIPIILISAFADITDWVEGLQLGAADYITKPFQSEELLSRVRTHLALRRATVLLDEQAVALRETNEQLHSEIVERQRAENELRRSLDRADQSRRALLSTLEDQKRAEDELRFRNLILSTQQEASIDGILVVDVNGKIVSSNRRFADMWGIPVDIVETEPDESTLQWVTATVANPEEFLTRVKRLYATPDERSQDEIALKDGRTFDRHSAPMVGADGKHFGRVSYFRDITERKRAEKAVLESEERFRILFEQAADSILLLDIVPAGMPLIRDANGATFRNLGYERDELIGQPLSFIDPESDVFETAAERKRSTLAGKGAVFKARHRCKDGTIREFECSVAEIQLGSKTLAISVERDITERKRAETERDKLEEQLRVSQKMEAIGSLAGGVAHDFNNLLSVILSYTGLAMEGTREGDPLRNDLLEVKHAGERAATLTRQLLAFSRKQVLQPVPLDLNQIATGVEKMLRRILGEDIDLVQVLAPDLGVTLADPGQLEQVLMNLVVNARDAMPEGGKLTIDTRNLEIDEEYAKAHMAVKPGSYVQLAVTDTGCGMDEETKARLFEPFFTTKEKGKGTGLGLSTVYGIVKQSGGNIWVYSELGRGTTFKIYLPRDLLATAAATIKPPTVPRRSTGTETVLVVEDEQVMRKVAKRILDAAGYRVLTAADGDHALLTCLQHAGDIHLLLTDVVMPGMSGRVLAQELSKTRPTLKVLYMSGYTDDAIVHHGVLEAGTHFLAKPFTSVDLTQKVREVMDGDIFNLAYGQELASENDSEAQKQPLDKATLRALPRDLLGKLRTAVIALRYDEIVELIETIQTTEPDLAAGLRQMANTFDYVGMRDFLRE